MSEKMPIDIVVFNPAGQKVVEMTPEDITAMSPEKLAAFMTSVLNSPHPVNLPNLSAAEDVKPAIKKNTEDQSYPLLSEAIEQFYEHKKMLKSNFKPSAKQKTVFRRLIEILGNTHINNVKATDADLVLKYIQRLPSTKAAIFRNKTVIEILEHEPFNATFSIKNTNDYLIEYRALFKEMNRLYQIPNIFAGLTVKETDRKPKEKLSFNRNDLKILFSQPLFQSGEYENQYQFWTPLIALLSGARRVEIAQLRTYDIVQEGDIWYFNFNEEIQNWDDGYKKIKNRSSFRKTPVHLFLIDLGLLDFKNSLNQGRLFPDSGIWTDKEGYGRNIGEKFNKFSKQAGVARGKTFKSFRATVLSELERMGVTPRDINLVAGHVKDYPTVRETHYLDNRDLPYLFDQINKLDFSDELAGVRPKTDTDLL